jgi:transcriptional regulator with XRE-family HTH domain
MTKQFGRQLAMHRKEKGWSQTKLAQYGDINPATVSLLEKGDREPSREMVVLLSSVLKLSPDEQGLFLLLAGFMPQKPEDFADWKRDAVNNLITTISSDAISNEDKARLYKEIQELYEQGKKSEAEHLSKE